MKNLLFFILTICSFHFAAAQNIKGTVVDNDGSALAGAYVIWVNTSEGTITDEAGNFEITGEEIEDKRFVVSFIGYQNDTFPGPNDANLFIQLTPDSELSEVVVESRKSGGHISSKEVGKVEIINSVELGKAACCDLAGCFNNNASVEPATTNIVTNSKELRILGLSGMYNQVLLDGFPLIQGLSFPYGVSSVPGPFVDNIMIAKGTTSVLQGSESISGQINVLLTKPVGASDLYVNLFMNSFWEKQANIYTSQTKGKFSHVLGVHTVQPAGKFDHNEDNFLDLPQLTRYQIFDKFKVGNDKENGWFTRGGIRFTNESRTGGEVNFDAKKDLGSSTVYGQQMNYNQFDIWDKTSYRFNEFNATAFIASGQYHKQESWFGETNYKGTQSLLNLTGAPLSPSFLGN
ncbi:MAG: TonB-dependent receptor, partial [Saprospiraceae bacterium]